MSDQLKMESGKSSGPVECLGMSFPSEDARRDHYLNLLAEKLRTAVQNWSTVAAG